MSLANRKKRKRSEELALEPPEVTLEDCQDEMCLMAGRDEERKRRIENP